MIEDLIEESESHVVILFLLRFLLFLLLLGSWSSSSCCSCTTPNRGKLLASFSDQSSDILTLQILEDKIEVGTISLDSHGSKNFLDVGGVDLLFGLLEQKCCSNVTHV